MYGIFYNYVDEQDFLCQHMIGTTVYTTKELADKALRTQYGNSCDYTVEKLELIS